MNLSAKKKKTVVDPVCGMAVVPGVKEIITSINGQTYYFCAPGCKASFEKDPEKYLSGEADHSDHDHDHHDHHHH